MDECKHAEMIDRDETMSLRNDLAKEREEREAEIKAATASMSPDVIAKIHGMEKNLKTVEEKHLVCLLLPRIQIIQSLLFGLQECMDAKTLVVFPPSSFFLPFFCFFPSFPFFLFCVVFPFLSFQSDSSQRTE
jgi:hypothetical protein